MRAPVNSVLNRVEDLLAAVFEGTMERLFRVKVQPAQIARRAARTLEDSAMIGVDGQIAPNHFWVHLDGETYLRMQHIVPGLEKDLERHLAAVSARRRMRTMDSFRVKIEPDSGLDANSFTVQAEFLTPDPQDARRAAAGAQVEHTVAMPLVSVVPSDPPASLELRGPDATVRTIPLAGGRCTIGRAADNDIVLPEPAVSRYHASVSLVDGKCLVEDLGSTNGVHLNGKRVTSSLMRDGDRLRVGASELVLRHR